MSCAKLKLVMTSRNQNSNSKTKTGSRALSSLFLIVLVMGLRVSTAAAEEKFPNVKLRYAFVKGKDVQEHGCLSKHMEEAAQLNKNRKKLYEMVTEGKTKHISDRLITLENRAKMFSFLFDGLPGSPWGAYQYNKAGIPIMCADVEPMSKTPSFKLTDPVALPPWKELPIKQIKYELNMTLKMGTWKVLETRAMNWISELSMSPRFGCMTRHLLESVARVAAHAEDYRRLAKERNLKDPQELLVNYIKIQIYLLGDGGKLDVEAMPFQARGIPIICNDVPHLLSEVGQGVLKP